MYINYTNHVRERIDGHKNKADVALVVVQNNSFITSKVLILSTWVSPEADNIRENGDTFN